MLELEVPLASGRMGIKTLLLTQSIDAIGQLSCNPSIGGIGKGHLVREIDALGGAMGVADQSGIHFKTLNLSKGPAVRATRAQIDRDQYKKQIQLILSREPNITVMQQQVKDLDRARLFAWCDYSVGCKNSFRNGHSHGWHVFKRAYSCWAV